MAVDWKAMRRCFCALWFGKTAASRNNSGGGGDTSIRQQDEDAVTNDSLSYDDLCSSLWGNSTAYTPSYANVIEELLQLIV